MALVDPSQTLREYYTHAELELPANPRFHQYRLRTDSGFLVVKDCVRNPENLRRWLVRYVPLDCYATVNEFLNPSEVSYAEFNGKRAGFNHANNLLLGDGILIFDVDFHERGFSEAKADVLRVQDYLRERGYFVDEVVFTGAGFHVKCFHHDLYLPRCYSSRNMNGVFAAYRKLREPFLDDLEKLGIHCDREITLDARRIARIIGTVNSKNGYICKRIRDLEGFDQSEAVRLHLEGNLPATLEKVNDARFSSHKKMARTRYLGEGCSHTSNETKPDEMNPANLNLKPAIYLSTIVIDTVDRQIVLLRFKSDVNVERLKTGLSKFAAQEQLAPFLIFRASKDPEGIWGLSPSAVQTAGMKRLLKRFPRDNSAYQKFRRRIVPLPLEYVAQSSGDVNSEIPVSHAHFKYFQHYSLLKFVPKILCGSESLLSMPIGEMRA